MNTNRSVAARLLAFGITLLTTVGIASAASFTPGNIVVYRVGDGTAALGTGATVSFFDEYTPAGTLVQTIPLPTTTVGSNRRLTAAGSQAEGLLNRSVDGGFLLVAGYDAATGTAAVAGTTSATVNRVVGRVTPSGTIDTTTALTDASSASNIRSAITTTGTDLWITGGAGGVRYTTVGATTSVQLNTGASPATQPVNLRGVGIFSGQLYFSDASGTAIRLGSVGTGTPTTAGQNVTNLPGYITSTGSPYGFFFADLDGTPGVDTVYIADDTSAAVGLQKWCLVSGTWVAEGTLSITGGGARGITGIVSGTSVTLYVANGTSIQKVTDASGFAATITGTVSSIASAGTNKAFRGVAFVPQASPTVLSINRVNTNPTSAATVNYTVVFSEMVTGVDATDFALTTSGVTGASVGTVTGSGDTYNVSVNTGSGEGTIRLDVTDDDTIANEGGVKLGGTGASNGNFTAGQLYTIDHTPPTVSSITGTDPILTNLGSVHYTVTFSESVTGVDAADFSVVSSGVTGASVTGVSGSGTTWTVTVGTGSGDGTVRLDLTDNDSITDTAGNPLGGSGAGNGNATGATTYTIDKTAPTVTSVTRVSGTPTNASTVDFTVTFSESVVGVDTSDFTSFTTGGVSGSSVTNVTGSGSTRTVTVNTGSGSGTIRLDVANDGSIKDAAGNSLGATFNAGEVYTIDRTPPAVTSINRVGGSPTNAQSVDFTVTFTKSVTGVDSGDFALATTGVTGASITNVVASGTSATVTVDTGSGDGTVGLNLTDNDSIIDSVGNPLGGSGAGNGNFTGQIYSIDKTAPTVSSITRVGGATSGAASVDFTATFSESVTGVDSGDFALTTTGVSGTSITNVSGSGTTYTVTVNTGSGNGTIRLDVADNDSIIDGVGNPLGGIGAGNGNFTTGEVYTIDKSAPVVASIVRADSNPTNATTVNFTVTFSGGVNGVDTSDFALATSGVTASITGVSGSGSAYTVTVSSVSGNGTLKLNLTDDDSITAISNGAPLGGAGTGNGDFTAGETYTVDQTAPTVQSIVRANASPTHASSVDFTITFSESVTGVASNDFSIVMSGVSGATIANVAGSGSTYTVTVNTGSGDGTLRLDFLGSAVDSAGNGTSGVFTSGQSYTIDKTPPTVQSITRIGAATTNAASVQFTVTYSEPVTGVSAQDWSLTTTGVTGASVTGFTGSGTTYTVTVNTGTGDGTIKLNVVTGGTVIDVAGNLLATGFTTGDVDTIDKTAPAVQSIAKASTDPTTATSVDFTVTFSESVTGVDASDFTITAPSLTGTSVTNVTGSGSGPYTVTVNTGSGSGSLRLDLTGDGTIVDAVGNSAASYTGGPSYTIQGLPTAPTGLLASPGDSHVALTWNPVSGADTYTVKRSLTSGTGYSNLATGVAVNTYDDTTAVNGTPYFYKVSATNGRGEGPDSSEVTATPAVGGPAPGPVSIAVGDTKVILSWPVVAGATSYNVKRGTTTGSYGVVTNTLVPTFTDSTVTNGTTYFYVVTALSPAEGSASAEVSGTPNTPSVLGVVFSTVYGGGGNAGATLKNDYMELFNRGTQTVSLAGWSVQYTSAAATTWAAANSPTALSGTIAPGHYYLVQEGPGAGGSVNLPTPDASGLIAMGATAGKVALVGNTTGLTGACPTGTFIADFVGYGPTATCSETSPTAVLSNTTAALRNNNGCTDTNNNNSDFTVGAPNPRNSASPVNVCGAVNNPPTITPPGNPIASVAQDAAPFTVNLTGSDDGGVYQWTATPGTGLQSVTVSGGQGTANVTYTVTLTAGYSGTATFTATLSDGINAAVNQLVNIQVTGTGGNNAPLITPPANPITTVAQDPAPFTVNVSGTDDGGIFNWSATPGTGVASVNVTGGQGTATVTYTVALNAGFNGTATFTASLSDNVNPTANQAVNINVLPAGATPNHVVISQLYGGGGNSSATYTNDFIELFNPTASPVSLAGWSVQYSSATNTGAFSGLQPIGGTIGPGEYYLISLASGGAVGGPLPLANVVNSSGFNMSGTAGKVALVSTGTPVPGPCSATATDTDIVDLVGYGTTANCNEGGTNAPAPSNTTSDFRKNGGNTDTNVNGNDFLTGTPNPRRTTPIQEFGPAIVNTDPANNASAAPRDDSMIITFTELVDVDPGWYNINCSVTGNHNDATVVEGAPDTWVITPNVNFTAAEQCSVTIFANSVHDRDTDDSAPGTDTLASDYTWTFTVSSGTPPPYPASVHLTMGMPSVCTTSLSSPSAYLMLKPENSICYNRDLGRPNWVSWHLTDEWFGSLARVDTFRPDPEVPPAWYRVLASDFFASGFDRGHMTPNADRDSQVPIVQSTFLMSNMVAQSPDNNQGPWAALENDLRTIAGSTNELYIVSGPFGTGGTGSNGGTTNTVANGHVTVPASTWKCALVLPKASGDDVARVTASTRTICVIMPNIQGIRNDDWHIYLKSVDQVEALTGYDLFSNVPPAIQNAIEAGLDGANPPGAADQSTSTNEDVQKSITLDAATPGGALTYTILTGPFHGGLTGTGANQTYTPAPDFNGTDTFTWRVNDGTNNSNTATMTITVAEVNDPPVAVDDSKSTTSNTPLIFASSDLTTNDSAGPANEAGQTLTVTAVTPTGSTHGTVSLTSGQITYTPTIGYSGPASFTYSVCDNGTTAGSAAPLCATATVNVTVSPAPPATHFSVTAPANVTNGVAFNITVTALDASNATATGYTGTVHFTSSSSGTLPSNYTFTGGDLGVHTFSVTLTSNGSRTITATDTITPSITGTATTNVLSSVTHYSVTAPASTLQGTPFNVTVTALDASNAVITSYTGTAHFTSSSAGTLPADYTFVGGDNGTHTFSVTLTATGTQTITATDTVTASITGTASTSVALVCPPGPAPTATASNSGPACVGNSVTLFSSGSGTVFSWTGPGGFTSNLQNPSGINVAGTYTVTVSSTGPCGGSAQASTTVVINPLPAAAITSGGTACALSTGNNASIADAGVGATYTWSITNGTITSGITTRAIVYTAGASGNVHLSVTVGAVSGCSATGSADIAISSAPAISVQPVGQIVNPGNNATFTVTATGLNLHYQWFVRHPSGITLPVGTDSSSYTTNPEGNAWWFVRVSNSCGTVDSVSVDALVVTPRHRPTH